MRRKAKKLEPLHVLEIIVESKQVHPWPMEQSVRIIETMKDGTTKCTIYSPDLIKLTQPTPDPSTEWRKK